MQRDTLQSLKSPHAMREVGQINKETIIILKKSVKLVCGIKAQGSDCESSYEGYLTPNGQVRISQGKRGK